MVNHALALYSDADPDDQSYFEKNLDDFFSIQVFSTVYFGSRHEPHKLIFDTGSSWLWV